MPLQNDTRYGAVAYCAEQQRFGWSSWDTTPEQADAVALWRARGLKYIPGEPRDQYAARGREYELRMRPQSTGKAGAGLTPRPYETVLVGTPATAGWRSRSNVMASRS